MAGGVEQPVCSWGGLGPSARDGTRKTPCPVLVQGILLQKKAGLLPGNNNVNNIVENADFLRLHLSPNSGDLRGNKYCHALWPLGQGDVPLREPFRMRAVSTCVLSQPGRQRVEVGLGAAKRLEAPGKAGPLWARGLQSCPRV